MSANVYEDLNMTTTVRYSKGVRKDRGDRLEKIVDIYESADAVTPHRVGASTQDKGAHTQIQLLSAQRNRFRSATVVLAVLCFLLLVGMAFLSSRYFTNKQQLQQLTEEVELTANSDCQSEEEDNALGWRRFKRHCYYTSTERKTWAESKEDCQTRGADLVVIHNKDEQEFVSTLSKHGDAWIGLEWVIEWKSLWKWVDGSELEITAWNKDVIITPRNVTKAYIDTQGRWSHASSGAKHWICERQIY